MRDSFNLKEDRNLDDIGRRLDKLTVKQTLGNYDEKPSFPKEAIAIIGRVATELVAGVVVGTFLGWALDRWLETSPLFLLIMFFLGAVAGTMNVWRVFTGRGMAIGYFDEHKKSSADEKLEG